MGNPSKPAAANRPASLWTRRSFLNRTSFTLLSTTLTGSLGASIAALFQRVRPRPESRVILGRPEEFAVGEVSERWKKSDRIILVRNENGFYALRSVCTHLGCIPGWQASQKKFKCFCHGSGFHADGVNFEGPAPRPLERLEIFLDDNGRIVVDTAARLRSERGEWAHKGAFLKWKAST